MLTSSELERLRQDMNALLTETASVLRPVTDWDDVLSVPVLVPQPAVACRIDLINREADRQPDAAAPISATPYRVTLPWDAQVAVGDLLTVRGESFVVLVLVRHHSDSTAQRAVVMREGGDG